MTALIGMKMRKNNKILKVSENLATNSRKPFWFRTILKQKEKYGVCTVIIYILAIIGQVISKGLPLTRRENTFTVRLLLVW